MRRWPLPLSLLIFRHVFSWKFWIASSNPVGWLASPNSGDFARRKAPMGGEIQELWNAQLAKSPHQPGVPPPPQGSRWKVHKPLQYWGLDRSAASKSSKISAGKYTEEGRRHLDLDRIRGAEYKESDKRKKKRKVLRGQRKKTKTNKQRMLPMLLEHFKTLAFLRAWTEGFETQVQLLDSFFCQAAFW